MNIVTEETKAKSLQALRQQIAQESDPKKKYELGKEAAQLRAPKKQTPKR